MIVANEKGVDAVLAMLPESGRVLVAGCDGCTAVCHVGGEKEARTLAQALRVAAKVARRELTMTEYTVTRQCEPEFLEELADAVAGIVGSSARPTAGEGGTSTYAPGPGVAVDVVVSVACGVGVQMLAERFEGTRVVPGVDTTFYGTTVEHGVWEERCQGCGDCVIGTTHGLCPIARCAKSLLFGPCGGSQNGWCEVGGKSIPCIWDMIVRRAAAAGEMEALADRVAQAKDWSTARDGGQRKRVREDMRIAGTSPGSGADGMPRTHKLPPAGGGPAASAAAGAPSGAPSKGQGGG